MRVFFLSVKSLTVGKFLHEYLRKKVRKSNYRAKLENIGSFKNRICKCSSTMGSSTVYV